MAAEPHAVGHDVVRRHLELRTAAVVASVLDLLDGALGRGLFQRDDVERRFPFLAATADELAALAEDGSARDPDTFRRMAAQLALGAGDAPPLARLAAWAEASAAAGAPGDWSPPPGSLAADLVAAAALVERDVRFGAVMAALQEPAGVRRPGIGLLATVLQRDPDEVAAVVGSLVAGGFLALEQHDAPRAEQVVRLPRPVLAVLEGRPGEAGFDLTSAADALATTALILPAAATASVERAAELLGAGDLDVLVLRGPPGTGRRTVLRAVAGRLGAGLLLAGADQAATATAVAVLTGAVLAWTVDPGLGQLVTLRRAPGAGPVGVVTGIRGAVQVEGGERTAVIELDVPDPAARRRFWAATGIPADSQVLDDLSRSFIVSGGTIGRLAAQAGALGRLDGRSTVAVHDVGQAAQDQGRQRLESLAELLPRLPEGFAPVLGGAASEAYEALVLRSRHREGLAGAVGGPSGGELTRGVRALFSGPSGTGKTHAARALGTRLGLDVYRADLAALVDKYIGETERRLDELFSRAEELDVVLLIDEGDALMTRRTDVRSSNDRYANLETDYLLQRLERYQGIVVITTNAAQLVDTAFRRRLDVSITFAPPGRDERLRIWRQHLPERHAVTPEELERVAAACRLTGGQIRNAAVHAALLALERDRLVDDVLLDAGVARELTAAGLSSPFVTGPAPVSPFERASTVP